MKQLNCRLCNSKLGEPVLKLPPTTLANEYLEKPEAQDLFPLEICCCSTCGHYQLNETVDPERLFRKYLFVAGTSPVNVEHFKNYALSMIGRLRSNFLFTTPKVLDIASNDGTLLRQFQNLGCDVLGIDPAINLAAEAAKKGIPTIPDFFTEQKANEMLEKYGQFDIITANNVFAHVPDMIGFIKGVKTLLSFNGIFSFEVSYFADVCDHTLFDTIYHEHTSYHTLQPLMHFFKQHGMQIVDAIKINTHGGSIRVIVEKSSINPIKLNIVNAYNLNILKEQEYNMVEKIKWLGKNIKLLGYELREKLQNYKQAGKSIAIYGTPAKATTLMYALGIDEKMIDFAVDDAPLKQGHYTPGKHIPILSPDAIYEKKPDVLLILAWNFANSIMQNHKDFKGTWLVPIPELKEYS